MKEVSVMAHAYKIELTKENGIQRALFDDRRAGGRIEITDDTVTRMIVISCQ